MQIFACAVTAEARLNLNSLDPTIQNVPANLYWPHQTQFDLGQLSEWKRAAGRRPDYRQFASDRSLYHVVGTRDKVLQMTIIERLYLVILGNQYSHQKIIVSDKPPTCLEYRNQ